MPTSAGTSDNLYFLSGGGEMGELTRSYNWQKNPLGPPEQWPQGLQTTLGIVLHSAFPMFLFWGQNLICFYNDAFRPSLGIEGKHPAVGKKGKEVWEEIWDFIGPLVEKVMATGEPVYFEDQLVPFYRNGRMEDIYWTFSYSPAYGDGGKVNGVFVTCTETTENIRTRKALEEGEQRFRTMAEGTDVLIAVGDETSNATYFNKAWTNLTGRPMKELLQFGWSDLIHPEDKERYVNIYLDAFKDRVPFTGEFRVKSKNGDYRWLLAKGLPRFRSDDSFAGYISSCIDITERKATEKLAKDNETLLRSMVASAPFPIGVYVGREMRISMANQSIIDVWGKGSDVIGKTYFEVLPELANQSIYQQLDHVFTTGIPFHARNQYVDIMMEDGLQRFYFNYSFTPLYDNEGKVYGVMNTAADVTDLNVAKQRIEQSERNFRNMILQAPVAMCIMLGPSHVVEVANKTMLELWGKPVSDVMYKPIFEGLPDAKEQGLEALLDYVYNTGETFTANERPVELIRKGKYDTIYQNFVYEPYKDGDGNILGVLAISIDVTDQVLARQKIEEAVTERTKELASVNNNLQKSNAELAQFAYIASHDLQEPLRKISTFTEMLANSAADKLDDHSKRYLDKINSSSSRMHALIRDVLSYSELVRDSEVFESTDLNKILQATISDYDLLIEQKSAAIRHDKLPVIEAIPLQMSQLFFNLIGNSLKFSKPEHKPVINVSVVDLTDAEKQNTELDPLLKYIKIQFCDNGIGFKEEHADQIFHIFQRLHGKSEYEGTGIGLALCKKIVLNHHGHLNAIGSSEEGAVFNVILPLKQERKR